MSLRPSSLLFGGNETPLGLHRSRDHNKNKHFSKTGLKKKLKYLIPIAGLACIFGTLMDELPGGKLKSFNLRLLRTFHAPEELQEWIDHELELGWNSPPAEWLKDLCPEVVEHFIRFPSAKNNTAGAAEGLPFMPTEQAAQSVCTMKIIQSIAASLNSRLYLHAGSHLGAVVHGQIIPWDDDLDAIMDYRKKKGFAAICEGDGIVVHPSGVRLRCVKHFNAYKVWLHYEGMVKLTNDKMPWYSPFVDLFFYKIEDGRFWELLTDGRKRDDDNSLNYALSEYFPTRPYYFAGIYLLGPQVQIVEDRYKLEVCKMSNYNHRLEKRVHQNFQKIGTMDCEHLAKRFPFKQLGEDVIKMDGDDDPNGTVKLFPWKAADMSTVLIPPLSIEQREEWYDSPDSDGQRITDALENHANINEVEIDNSISPQNECTGPLKVVELNTERGRWWMESVNLVKDADVIILNEMDIGMARSDNQHTTRLMAHFLGMNYAWGLEFVELTPGVYQDRYDANGLEDFHGLHGNAFLTKCTISEPVIFRDQIGQYFSSGSTPVNAGGKEKRLGGRMGMFGSITVDGKETVIGSVHKLDGFRQEVLEYIGQRDAIIAGDQNANFCKDVNLSNIVSEDGGKEMHYTWPASCNSLGDRRGDNICSNMKMVGEEVTTMPCVTEYGFSTKIGDHALTSAVLAGNQT